MKELLKQKILSRPINTLITILGVFLLFKIVYPIFRWALWDAHWQGTSREACTDQGGACWVFIKENLFQFLFGFYPEAEIWRVFLVFFCLVASFIVYIIAKKQLRQFLLFWIVFALPILSWKLLLGFASLPIVNTSQWGGVFLTLIVSLTGIATSLPLGILLALARRSKLPVLKTLAILFIEVWRGVPLITVLFMSSVMLPLILPSGFIIDKLIRALVAVSLFSAAYMAEVVRGGLQAIPRGQSEASQALGLNFSQYMSLVIMPQALKHVIPGIVNSFIALFKDTTLVSIIGMFDLLGIIQAASTHPDWLGFSLEGYVFAGVFYWIFCFSMSRYSQKLELKLNRGT